MCGLQKLQCEFSYAGCGAEFIRDHQKEHMEQNTQKHLALVAAATLKISQRFDQKLQEKDVQIRVLATKLSEQQRQVERQTKLINLQDQQIKELKRHLEYTKVKLLPLTNQLRSSPDVCRFSPPYHTTITRNPKVDYSLSPPLHTHPGGYTFRLLVWSNGALGGRGTHVSEAVCPYNGDNDGSLAFPARFIITLELLNQHRDQDHHRRDIRCVVTRQSIENTSAAGANWEFFSQARLKWNERNQTQYLKKNCLKFKISKIVAL